MRTEVQKEFFVVGYEQQDGSLKLYCDTVDNPYEHRRPDIAHNLAQQLNKQPDIFWRPETARTPWQVYQVRFKVVETVPLKT